MARPPAFTEVNTDALLVGSVVADRYLVKGVLGQGATGTVFAVDHMHIGRPAAMKVLRPRYVGSDVLMRVFHGEARAAWTVSHPCLAEVFDIGTLPDGGPFFVTERLEGETLAARITRERLSTAAAVDVMMQLLAALAEIHSRALVVRDLRPQNVYLTHRRGCRPLVKVLDFGLARLVPLESVQEEWDALRANAGSSEGTGTLAIPYYLSPERTRGEHGVEAASDVYVAAIIFYEALTGEKPFLSTSFKGLLLQIGQSRPVPLCELRPDVPEELGELIARALSANPRNRPASAKEFQDELRGVFEGAKRGSTSLRAAARENTSTTPPSAAGASSHGTIADTAAHSPRDVTIERTAPPEQEQQRQREDEGEEPIPEVTAPSFLTSQTGNIIAAPSPRAPLPPPPLAPPPRLEPPAARAATIPDPNAHQTAPPTSATDVPPPTAALDDLYSDETETDRKLNDTNTRILTHRSSAVPSSRAEGSPRFDEASADNPQKTVRPPAPSVDVQFEPEDTAAPTTSRPDEQATAVLDLRQLHAEVRAQAMRPIDDEPEEETETMQLTPELRARLDQMMKAPPKPVVPQDAGPPQTRRMKPE